MKQTTFQYLSILMTTVVLTFLVIYSMRTINTNAKKCSYCEGLVTASEHIRMYNKSLKAEVDIMGVYFGGRDQYMCIWLEGRSELQINHTIDHEYLHYLIDDGGQWKHFCED